MDNPDHGMYWPIHVPMTKAIIRAMDAVQQIMMQTYSVKILLLPALQNGLSVWLAVL